jgi:hypothetical protein
MNLKCIRCKGSDPLNNCGKAFCPIIAKSVARFKVEDRLGKDYFFGDAPAPFVGRFGYPNINVGILSVEGAENSWQYDAPQFWSNNNLEIPKIVEFRSSLVNSRFKSHVKSKNSKLLEISQEVGMASKPVEIEVSLEQKPKFRLQTDDYLAPMGPNAKLKNAQITSNPKISNKVERVVDDADLKAHDGIVYLHDKGFDENFLSKLLSVGMLGAASNRKLVPTRWSITATDDLLAKHLRQQVHRFAEQDYCAYFGGYLGNYYLVLLFPEVWSYELFETYLPRSCWNISDTIQSSTDYEPYEGRKDYAEETVGGYYAARLAILEQLNEMKRQASVLCLRFITGEYAVPLGVWVVREATRKAMQAKPISFSSKELMLTYAKHFVKKKFGYNLDFLLGKSKLLKNMKVQEKLTKFMS